MTGRDPELNAVLIAPDRDLAKQFIQSLSVSRAFQIVSDLKAYLPEQTLEMRLRQWKPDVVLVDFATDPETAAAAIKLISNFRPVVHVVALHTSADPEIIMKALRLGATEFLHAPFDPATEREAAGRIRRLRPTEAKAEPETATVFAFASTKPGSGASTLAAQCAFAIRRITGKKVLLVDFDLLGGTVGFYLKIRGSRSMADLLGSSDEIDAVVWSNLVAHSSGIDVLPSPEEPFTKSLEQIRLHEILDYARRMYDFVLLDLPSIFHRNSMLCLAECDHAYLVTTSELPSLHLTRKAITMLGGLGFDKERYRVVVNRLGKRDGLSGSDLEKMFSCPVQATFPNDYFSLHRVVTLGEPLGAETELGRSVENLAGKLSGVVERNRKAGRAAAEQRPALSQA